MKQLLLIPLLFSFSPVAFAGGPRTSQPGWSHQEKCYKTVYREEYVPGTMRKPGYVKSYKERVKVPCEDTSKRNTSRRHHHHNHQHVEPRRTYRPAEREDRVSHYDDNSCVEGTIIGGILGGAAGGTLATKKNWIWSIPAGVVGGAMVGCQVDGG
tara:strand:+ start:241 stop:705 length:465 start_codon:yes stop_codon:yes gene_type:complete